MPNPVTRSHLSTQIFAQLRDAILTRVYLPGARLPPERELCKLLGVNRGPMREALKRLEQARLIDIRQGDGTIVRDFEIHGGLELLPALAMPGGRPNFGAVRSMFECRALVAPEMARLAALRRTPARLAELAEVVRRIEEAASATEIQDLDLEFHGVVARAAENIAYLLIYNSARDLYLEVKPLLRAMFDDDPATRRLYRRIHDAIGRRAAPRALTLCRQLIDRGGRRALALIERAAAAQPSG